MAIKFSFGKRDDEKSKVEQETVPVKEVNVGIVVVPTDEEPDEDAIKNVKKDEMKYIRLKKTSGIFAAVGAGIFAIDGAVGIKKAIKEKDATRGIAAGIATFIGLGLGGAAGFVLTDVHHDKKEFNKKYGKNRK